MAYSPGDRCPLCGGTLRQAKTGEGLLCSSCGLAISGIQAGPGAPTKQEVAPAVGVSEVLREQEAVKGPLCPHCKQPFEAQTAALDKKVTGVYCANCQLLVGVVASGAAARSATRRKATAGKKSSRRRKKK